MPGEIENPRIWANADVYTADVGTTAPTDVAAAWGAGWEPLGLLSEDGMTEGREEDSTDLYAWGGVLVRTIRSRHKRTLTVTALESNATVFGLVNPGSTVTTTDGLTTREIRIPERDPRAFGVELRDGDIVKRRLVPRGEVVAVGEVTASDSAMEMFELTINIYPDSDGVLYIELTDDPAAVAAP